MSDAPLDLLSDTARAWGLPLTSAQREQFATYAAELQQWNHRANLTAITDTREIVTRHFLDALICARHWGDTPRSLIDIGSGAGFPGLPLKLLQPDLRLTLVESVGKKAAFLQHMAERLALDQVEVLTMRAETAAHTPQHRATYDVATARAVADLRVLAEYTLPFVRPGGCVLAPKGADIEQEVDQAQSALTLLGGQLQAIEPVLLPDLPPRTLVVIRKVAPTPAHYPRAVGVPARRPLR